MKNAPAAREDAEGEEQKNPKAGDVLTEQDAYLLKNTRNIFENLGRNLLEENKRKEQALHRIDEITLESAGHKRRADEMSEEVRLVRGRPCRRTQPDEGGMPGNQESRGYVPARNLRHPQPDSRLTIPCYSPDIGHPRSPLSDTETDRRTNP